MDGHEWSSAERELRDEFAAVAMNALVAALTNDEGFDRDFIAKRSYAMAEAMLIERKRIRDLERQ